jgi:hypothetical protein
VLAGQPLSDFLEDFPTVSREKAVAALEQAKEALLARAHPAEIVEEQLTTFRLPGAAAVVVHRGKVLHSRGYRCADIESGARRRHRGRGRADRSRGPP